jgi:hypothetical protein
MTEMAPLENVPLPPGIRSRFVHDINGLRIHMLEAGFEGEDRPCVLLLHGPHGCKGRDHLSPGVGKLGKEADR